MPDPLYKNITAGEASRGDYTDPVRQKHSLVSRQRAMRGDFTDGTPLVLIPNTIDLSTNPTATDTLTIGGDVYEFVATSGAVADDANIAVEIGGTAAATLLNLLAAINGTAEALHPNITNVATTAPALGRGTEPVGAADGGSSLLTVYYTGTQGLLPANMSHDDYAAVPTVYPSFAFADALTAAVNWLFTNFNLLPLVNPVRQVNGMVALRIDVVTAILDVALILTFAGGTAVVGAIGQGHDGATGAIEYWDDVTTLVGSGVVVVTIGTGGVVDPANGDYFDLIVFGQFAGVQA